MANTYVDYVGLDGTGTDGKEFAFSFPYIKTSHVVVEINQGPAGGTNKWERTTAFTVSTSPSTRVVLDSTPNSLWKIRVLRDSDANTSLVDFANGSVLTETELDNAYLHNRYLAEEAEEGVSGGTISKNDDGQFNADGLRLENLADPDSDDDAVTKGYADGRYVDEAGDTMTGNLDMGSNEVTSSSAPSSNNSLTNKSYVDGEVATEAAARITGDSQQVTRTGDSMSGDLTMTSPAKVVQAAAPTTANDLTNKTYVDGVVAAEAANRASGDQTLTNSKVSKSGDTMTGALTLPGADPSSDNHATRKRYVDQQIAVAVSSGTPGGPIDTANISDAAITTDKIADDAVTAAKLDHTAVTPGSYTNTDITVDENGRITAASSGSSGAGATNLGNTPTANNVEITSSTGTNTTVAGATTSLAGVMTGADKTKLNGIETGATADQTASEILTAVKTVDGTGSGLDADLLDGQHASAFAAASHTHTAANITDFDTEVANNSAVAANTAKVSNATHTGDVTGSTALTITNNAVTSAKISDTDANFSINSSGQVRIGTTATPSSLLTVDGTVEILKDRQSGTPEGGQIVLRAQDATQERFVIDNYGVGDSIYRIYTPDDAGTQAGVDRFNIKASNGYVGISQNNPQYMLDIQGDVNITGDFRKNGNVIGGLSKYSSGWFNDSGTGLSNGSTYSFTHNLGTTDIQVAVYVNSSASDTNAQQIYSELFFSGGTQFNSGALVTSISSNSIELQLGQNGYSDMDSSGGLSTTTFDSKYIKVVVIG